MTDLSLVEPEIVQTVRRLTMRQQEFMDSSEAVEARQRLERLVADPGFNTVSSFTTDSTENKSFVDKHMQYMCEHPKTSIDHYISNLRLKTRVR